MPDNDRPKMYGMFHNAALQQALRCKGTGKQIMQRVFDRDLSVFYLGLIIRRDFEREKIYDIVVVFLALGVKRAF